MLIWLTEKALPTLARFALAAGVGAFLAMLLMRPSKPVQGPVAVATASPVEHEINALQKALDALSRRQAPVYQQPAITVVRDAGVKGLTDAEIAQILAAMKPPTVEKVSVGNKVVSPTPAPTPKDAFFQQVYQADYSATTHALKDTSIKTDVTISQQEVEPSRVGSVISSQGQGISYAFLRRNRLELDGGLVVPNAGTHLSGTAAFVYNFPHTSLGVGPSVTYNHGLHYGLTAIVHF